VEPVIIVQVKLEVVIFFHLVNAYTAMRIGMN